MAEAKFRLTYSTMFDPPQALHERFDDALVRVRGQLGRDYPQWIGGSARASASRFEVRSPIDRDWRLGRFPRGSAQDAADAVTGAGRRRCGDGRRRCRPRLGTHAVARTGADAAARDRADRGTRLRDKRGGESGGRQEPDGVAGVEANDGFARALPDDPLVGYVSRNRTVLKPYGVWAVIAPFNFPFALAGGPVAAALVAGNTVVFKTATDTAWSGWLLLEALRDAGLPPGVVNYVSGAGGEVGSALVSDARIAGVTFTGSYEVGMAIVRRFAQGAWPRPCIAEMGGKNAAIVSRRADLERAATGIVRSAFGLQGQKCSACSRVYVERPAAGALRALLVEQTRRISIGDPTLRQHWMGPLINEAAYARYQKCAEHLRRHGEILVGGETLVDGTLAKGWFVAPTVATAPLDYGLWREEKFIPLVLVAEVDSVAQAIELANASDYGLTAGFYGAPEEIPFFLERIEAGVTYVNRPQGATTGAWPGYQPFGGWKASGTTGKAIGSFYYLPQYLREQSQTVVE